MPSHILPICLDLQPNKRTFAVESQESEETRIPLPLLPHLVQRSPPLLPTPCCPTPHPPPATSAPLHGRRRLGTKMVVFYNGGDSYRTRPPTPTPGSDGSLAPKMPDSVPPSRKRRHPSRVPRLPFAAGGGRGRGRGSATERNIAGRGSPRENARGPPHSSLHCFVFRHFPVTLNHRRPPRRLSPPGALALGKNGSAEGEVILSIPPATRCC